MSDFSQFQLAGAFALSGDMNTALALLPSTITPRETTRETGGNFNSSTRAQAIMLDILSEVNENHQAIPMLVGNLTQSTSKYNRWHTTQENAFAFLAFGKMLKKQSAGQYTGVMKIDGQHFADFDSKDQRYEDKDWSGKEITLNIENPGICCYYWRAFGVSRDAEFETFDNLSI